jgi:hypothetical protein
LRGESYSLGGENRDDGDCALGGGSGGLLQFQSQQVTLFVDRQTTVITPGSRKPERLTADCTPHESNWPEVIHKLTTKAKPERQAWPFFP